MIREVGSKKIVTWLREIESFAIPLNPATGVLNLIGSGVNAAISAKGFSNVNQRLDGIQNQIGAIGKSLQFTQGILQVSTAASILNLGVSVIQAISQLGISFHEWLQLKPSTEQKPEGAELMFIIPSQPLELPG